MSTNSPIPLWTCIFIIFLLSGRCYSKLHVEIYNYLLSNVPTLTLHCQSKDNDLGFHTLPLNQLYTWSFRMNFWQTTLFFCHFWWGGKQTSFDVFDRKLYTLVGDSNFFTYQVRADGFYFWIFDPDNKTYSWQLIRRWDK